MIVHDVKQGSMEWHILRLGKVTSSRLCKVFKADNLTLLDELIAEDMTETWEDSGYISDEMQRGIDLEQEIIRKKHTHIANTGQENYRKSDAASDYFRELFRMVKGGEK